MKKENKSDKYLYTQYFESGFCKWYERKDGSFYQLVFKA